MQSTPKSLEPYRLADEMNQRRIDSANYSLGIYIKQAIEACFGGKYPEQPFLEDEKVTEKRKLDKLVETLQALEIAYKNKGKKNNGGTDE